MLGAFNTFGEEKYREGPDGRRDETAGVQACSSFQNETPPSERRANVVSGSELWSRRASHPGLPE